MPSEENAMSAGVSMLALVWSVPTPNSVNLRAIGTVKTSARGASLFAPTSVTLFCATRSALTGLCCANSMSHPSLRCEDSLDYPHIHVARVELSRADDHRAHLQRQLVVGVEIHLREIVHVM